MARLGRPLGVLSPLPSNNILLGDTPDQVLVSDFGLTVKTEVRLLVFCLVCLL